MRKKSTRGNTPFLALISDLMTLYTVTKGSRDIRGNMVLYCEGVEVEGKIR